VKHVVVIGGGIGGLAAAIRLARRNYRVTVIEKNEQVGGKMDRWDAEGFRFDTGPTLLTMSFVLEDLLGETGRRLEDHLDLIALDPLCRYFYADGTRLDASADRSAMARRIARLHEADGRAYARFIDHARGIYEASAEPFLFSGFASLRPLAMLGRARMLPAVFKLDAFRSLDASVSSYFQDSRVRQLFNRFATYTGSSPYRVPATLAVIPYVEFELGGWYVRGGMYRIAEMLESVAREEGVNIVLRRMVARIDLREGRASGVTTADGESIGADAIVCNADALYAYAELFGEARPSGASRYARLPLSTAGFVLLLGVRREFPALAHHNIFFSPDYRREFDDIVERGVPSDDPTVYVSISSKTDRDHAPPGCSNLFILVNVPPLTGDGPWGEDASHYRGVVLRTLARHGVEIAEEAIVVERVLSPGDFAPRYNAYRGAIYGPSSNGRMAAFLRPPNRARDVRNLFFVGGSSHPGGGVPLVMLSGKIVAGLVEEELG
jgi:phytoene desaturase